MPRSQLKLVVCLLIVILSAHTHGTPVYASEEFSTGYDTTYEINPLGTTKVTQTIKITNKQKDVIATHYSLIIRQMRVFDVKLLGDSKGTEIEVENKDNTTTIKATFSDYAIGQYKSKDFTVTYNTTDVVSKVGDVWNVNIPKIQNLDNVDDYNIKLIVPRELGPVIYLSPTPLSKEEDDKFATYYFNKVLLNNIGVDGAFGNKQLLNFKLDYILKNTSVFTKSMQIALPPHIAKQQTVLYKSLSPKPENVEIDQDGNYMATYKVGAKKTLNISANGTAEIFGKQIIPSFGGKFSKIPKKYIRDYTKPDNYWEADNQKIKDIATKLKNPNKTVSENAQQAYDYVVQNLHYDFNLVLKDYIDRNGALKALTQKDSSWACMEFTDSFIAIARAMGIPARELNGYAYAGDGENKPISIGFKSGDVLHAWPEFYDPAFGWIAVDPTWGTTSGLDYFTRLDTNHFAFARKGMNSIFPLPAGAYKLTGTEKQVEVAFSLNDIPAVQRSKIYKYPTLLTNPLKLLTKQQAYYFSNTGPGTVFINGKELPPFATHKLYVKRDDLLAGRNYIVLSKESNMYLVGDFKDSLLFYIIAFFVALVPCTILLVLITHLKDLRKVASRRLTRLRGQGQ